MKKVFSVLAVLLLCFSVPVTASASIVPVSVVQPFLEIVNDAQSKLYINGTTATCKSPVYGHSEVVEITAVQYLEKQGFLWIWGTYDNTTWSKTVNSNVLIMSNTKTGLTDGKYRLRTVFTLTDKYGESETITVYSDEKKVG